MGRRPIHPVGPTGRAELFGGRTFESSRQAAEPAVLRLKHALIALRAIDDEFE